VFALRLFPQTATKETLPMSFRSWPRGWRARAAFLLLLLVVAAASVVARSRPARQPDPETVRELLERLRAAGIQWQVLSAMKGGGPEQGVYLCDRPRAWEELQFLGRWPDLAPRWRGVVLVDAHPLARLSGGWQENGVAVGGLSLYGDPDMLRQMLTALGR
jgi:hypothetical protein